MERKQIAGLINDTFKETMGESIVLSEDLSNVVDAGSALFDANQTEQFVKTLINRIGREHYETKEFKAKTFGLWREDWDYGSVLLLCRQTKLPRVDVLEDYDLEDATSYDPYVTNIPKDVAVKYYNKRVVFSLPITIGKKQLKESFTSETALSSFVNMLFVQVANAMELAIENMIKRTINDVASKVIYKAGVNAVNLLANYATDTGDTSLTAATCLFDEGFLRYAAKTIGENHTRMKGPSTLFNVAGDETWSNETNTIYLANFKSALSTYLYNGVGQFNSDEIKAGLPEGYEIGSWQGTGTGYAFGDISTIKITNSDNHSVDQSGVLAVDFDKDAAMMCCLERDTEAAYNPKASYTNYFNKLTCGLFAQDNKNCFVYFIEDSNVNAKKK
ncbi:MAG: hypothetical protein MJZ20_09485 [Bacteroidaceae bacterium]|nr:hypothetical protein [Bacteroidaceae bacterium]